MRTGTPFRIDVNPRIPARLARLTDLANNLWYSFDRPTRMLFARLHPALWEAIGHCPKAMLKRIDEHRLTSAAADPVFLNAFNHVLSAFDTYMTESVPRAPGAARSERADRVFLRRVRHSREPADLLRRARHPRRGSLQGGERSTRCRSSPWARSTARAISSRPSTATASSGPSTAIPSSTICRSCPRCAADGSRARGRNARWPERVVHAQGLACAHRPRDAAAARHRHPSNSEHDRDIAHRLYGGDGICGSSRRCCSAWAVRARCARSASSRSSGTSTRDTPRS